MHRSPFLVFALATVAMTALLRADPPVRVYSPDKHFVVEWVDVEKDDSRPPHETRTITLKELPHGGTPFFLPTSPRDTRVAWSPDSKKCLILDGPDDGGPKTWLFIASKTDPQPKAFPIEPLKSIQDYFYKHTGDLWRGNITKILWADNQTLVLRAWDKNGYYRITVKTADPLKPVVQKLKGSPDYPRHIPQIETAK